VTTKDQFEECTKRHLLDGYEGSIARVYDSPYVNKRTKTLMKIKQFITEEFKIHDIVAGKGNKYDIAGTVFIQHNDKFVGCGIRGSWKYCKYLLDNAEELIGENATVRHFGETPDGSLRFPVCIDIKRPD
jgi:ATP-dependent DNA ligase